MSRYLRYRSIENERPPPPPPGEGQEQRLKRILRTMPAKAANNPALMLKFLRKTFAPSQNAVVNQYAPARQNAGDIP